MDYNLNDDRSQQLHGRFTHLVNRLDETESGRVDYIYENGGVIPDNRFRDQPSQALLIAVNNGLLDGPRAIASEIEDLFRDLDLFSPLEIGSREPHLDNIEGALDELENELASHSNKVSDGERPE